MIRIAIFSSPRRAPAPTALGRVRVLQPRPHPLPPLPQGSGGFCLLVRAPQHGARTSKPSSPSPQRGEGQRVGNAKTYITRTALSTDAVPRLLRYTAGQIGAGGKPY